MEKQVEELIWTLREKIQVQHTEIMWLRQEVDRYKMLLAGNDTMMNSLPTSRPDS